jgi:16S rRNA (cytosine1402-N4)-methyltransferase
MNGFGHTPVMVKEVVHFLKCGPGNCYIDGTVGGGGHARAILEASSPDGRLIGIDRDPDAVLAAREALREFGSRVQILSGTFSFIGNIIKQAGVEDVDGIILDLGVSSHQIDLSSRGFAFGSEGPLDMRMDPGSPVSAADVVNGSDEEELARIIFELGQERLARRIAKRIIERRKKAPIVTTKELADVVLRSLPPNVKRGRIHPATRTFQALRIFVNDELGELERFLKVAPGILRRNGRIVVISYHSLEDRLVKQAFKKMGSGYIIVTKKVIMPSDDEIRKNPRARSAKLRVMERE